MYAIRSYYVDSETAIMKSNYLLGKIYNNKSDFDLSETYLRKALAIAKEKNDYTYIGDSYFFIARANLIRNNFPEAVKNLNWSLQAYENRITSYNVCYTKLLRPIIELTTTYN